ncbi:hypothetical protein NBRC116583_06960 [Arenicella sp. 4NH20-0111]|uniref:hypothetical protein n=1 Tax=Arenicella sp. 4NH20-0111 TaxID=3127648 RepID=UPI003103684D
MTTMNDWASNVRKKAQCYSGSLMNNTKWRKALEVLIEHKAEIEVAFIKEENFHSYSLPKETQIKSDHIQDPGFGGPCLYSQIYSIRTPIIEKRRNTRTGATIECKERSKNIESKLTEIGEFPISICKKYLTLTAYES